MGILLTATEPPKLTFREGLIEIIFERFKELIIFIQNAMQVIATGTDAVSTAGEIVDAISNLIIPTAYVILSILVLIDIIDVVTRKGEEMRWEDVARILIKLVICKTIMEITPTLMKAMYDSASGLISQTIPSIDDALLEGLKTGIASAILPDPEGGLGKIIWMRILQILSFMTLWLMSWGAYICGLVIYVLAYGRILELLILQAMSPLPIAFAGWGETKDIPKKFLLTYFSVCLQGLAMVVCFRIYIALISSDSLTYTMLLVFTVALAVGVVKSGNWAKEILGLA